MKIEWKDCDFRGKEFHVFFKNNGIVTDDTDTVYILLYNDKEYVRERDPNSVSGWGSKEVLKDKKPEIFLGKIFKIASGYMGQIGNYFCYDYNFLQFTKYCIIEE